MHNKFFKQNHSSLLAGTIIVIIILSIVFFIIGAKCHIDNAFGTFFISLSASLFSIICTITFVQYYLDANKENESKDEEKNSIVLMNKYIMALYTKYKAARYELITRRIERNSKDFAVNSDFDFHSMCDLFYGSSLINNGMLEPVVFIFIKCEKELREAMIKMVTSIKFKHYPVIYDIAINFIIQSVLYDQSYAINSDYNTYCGEKSKVSDVVMNMIKDENTDYVKLFENNEIKSNIIIPYVLLYNLVKKEIDILNKYFIEINKL